MKKSERDALDNALARRLLRQSAVLPLSKLGTPTTPGVGDDETRDRDALRNPMSGVGDIIVGLTSGAPGRLGPGTDGQVLTVQADGTLAWEASSGGSSSGLYRDLIYELDGVGGFDFITDDAGNPMYVLSELE